MHWNIFMDFYCVCNFNVHHYNIFESLFIVSFRRQWWPSFRETIIRASDSNCSKSNFKSYKSFTRGCAMSQQRQRVNAIFISACFNLHFAFQSFPSDKDTPRTGLCKKVKSCYPYFKIKDFPSEETWVMGLYDTCSYQSTRGRQVKQSVENRKQLNERNTLSSGVWRLL